MDLQDLIIDLAFLSNPSCCEECSVIPPLSNSDHNGISLTLKWSVVKMSQSRKVGKYSRTNFELACAHIDATDWDAIPQGDCIDEIWDKWSNRFMSIMEQCLPRCTLPKRRKLP